MPISFNEIPLSLMTPGVYAEFDNSRAVRGLPGQPYKALIIGQRLTGGSVDALVDTLVSSEAQAVEYFGQGSMLHRMVQAFRASNQSTELHVIAVDDDAAAAAAAGSIDITGSATETGTLNVYIAYGGTTGRVKVGVTAGDAGDAVATALAAAISADANLPVTAVVNGTTSTQVDITARHKGQAGNDIDLRVNYYRDDKTPAGLATTITAMTGGATNPDITDVITAMGDVQYNVIAMPYTDAANLSVVETELDDRWGPMRPIDGYAVAAADGTYAEMSTLGGNENDPHISILACNSSPTSPEEWAAETAAIVAYYGQIDPARPFQTLGYTYCHAPDDADLFTQQERNLLLLDSVATFKLDAAGKPMVERLVTTYNLNAQGMTDTSYLDANILLTLSYLRYSYRARWSQKFPRSKLAKDGTRFGAGQAVVTPKVAKAELYSLFTAWENVGLVEDFDQFKSDLVVEINANDPNRLDMLLPPNLINQLRVTAAQFQFRV